MSLARRDLGGRVTTHVVEVAPIELMQNMRNGRTYTTPGLFHLHLVSTAARSGVHRLLAGGAAIAMLSITVPRRSRGAT
jgi:hypothetical protein